MGEKWELRRTGFIRRTGGGGLLCVVKLGWKIAIRCIQQQRRADEEVYNFAVLLLFAPVKM